MIKPFFAMMVCLMAFTQQSCDEGPNTTAKKEQARTEVNQRNLLTTQPPPQISWSLERDNLIKRFKLMNDRAVMFYMYVFLEGVQDPIGYYQINKVSSVDSQLTNPFQLVRGYDGGGGLDFVLPSPSEDGSYGTNGNGVFGFTPEDIYIEHNLKYMVATVPLHFNQPVNRLTVIDVSTEQQLKALMQKINAK